MVAVLQQFQQPLKQRQMCTINKKQGESLSSRNDEKHTKKSFILRKSVAPLVQEKTKLQDQIKFTASIRLCG